MTIRIFGNPSSRARRPLWVAREIGIDVETVVPTSAEMKMAPYLAINPNGKVPAIEDGSFRLFESFAIALYLAKKYGADGDAAIYPATVEDEALVWQWALWTANELEDDVSICVVERLFKAADTRDDDWADKAEAATLPRLALLDGALDGRNWILGDRFSVADIILASVVMIAKAAMIDFAPYPSLAAWIARCEARPAYA